MTDEIPLQKGIRCTDCRSHVHLTRKDNRTLAVRCDCGKERSIKLATTLPDGWRND